MTEVELPKTPTLITTECLFRHNVIASVLGLVALGHERPEAIELTLEEPFFSETGQLRKVSRRSIYRWLAAYREHGIDGLQPAERHIKSTALSDDLLTFLREQKTDDPTASIPELLRRAKQRELIAEGQMVNRVTAYRAAKRMELPLTCRIAKAKTDMRRFAHPNRMRMVLVDGKHFRAGPGRLKRVAFFFLDDCTRRVLAVVVGPSESTELLLRGLFSVICHFGLMDVIYFDRGSGFKSNDTHAVCIRLGIHFIHGRAHYPEGHGKVEAFNKTAQNDILRGLSRPEVDPNFGSLELRISHYLEHDYNIRGHESHGGDSPVSRWDTDERPLRFPKDQQELRSRFVQTENRRVSADNIVSVDGVHYEMPTGHAHQRLAVQRRLLDGSVWVLHDGKMVRLHPVDLAHNAEAHRAAVTTTDHNREAPLTAAAMAFERDFGPAPVPTKTVHPKRPLPNKEKP